MSISKLLLISISSAFLVACGGGNSSATSPTSAGDSSTPSTSAIDKYVGTWVSACDSFQERNYVTITKASETVLNYSIVYRQWSDASCTTGMTVLPESASGTMTANGTKTIGADTLDKFIQVVVGVGGITSGTFNQVVKFSATQFQLGNTDSGAPLDAQGYPNQLDPAEIYIKQ
jgi:hypothetical protein